LHRIASTGQEAAISDATFPLTGIKVVAFEQAVAAPLCTRHLADLGADVVKIERIGEGDFARGYDSAVKGTATWFAWLNRRKRSLTLDVKQPQGREVAEKLVAGADVVVQNFAPGAFDRLGLGVGQLHERYPGLIAVSITGYGEDGPYRDRRAYDLLVQGEAGVVSITGTPEEPARAGVSVADIAGGMYAFSAVLASLYRRKETGEGATIRVSLFDSLMEWMSPLSLMATHGSHPKRAGARHTSIVPYGPFPVAGGKEVMLAVQNEREWERLCQKVLDRPDLAADGRFSGNENRLTNRLELEQEIEMALMRLSLEEAEARLEAAQVPYGRLNDVADVLRHPQVLSRGRLLETGLPGGQRADLLRMPFNIEGLEETASEVPEVGQHTDAVLSELCYAAAEIAALRAAKAV